MRIRPLIKDKKKDPRMAFVGTGDHEKPTGLRGGQKKGWGVLPEGERAPGTNRLQNVLK